MGEPLLATKLSKLYYGIHGTLYQNIQYGVVLLPVNQSRHSCSEYITD